MTLDALVVTFSNFSQHHCHVASPNSIELFPRLLFPMVQFKHANVDNTPKAVIETLPQSVPFSVLHHHYGPWSACLEPCLEPQGTNMATAGAVRWPVETATKTPSRAEGASGIIPLASFTQGKTCRIIRLSLTSAMISITSPIFSSSSSSC